MQKKHFAFLDKITKKLLIVRQLAPKLMVLGLIIGPIITSLLFVINDPLDNTNDIILFAIFGGLGFLMIYLGGFAFYGLVKAIYKKQSSRAIISWIVLIGIYFLTSFAFELNGQPNDSTGVIGIGLMIMGGNEVWKIWKTRKPKSNNQSPSYSIKSPVG